MLVRIPRLRARAGARAASLVLLALAGLFGVASRPAEAIDLWPLYVNAEDEFSVLWPLFERDGNFAMVFPFYYRTNEGKDHHVLWPFLKISEGRARRVLPVWFRGGEQDFMLFPLIRQRPESTFWSIPPTYVRHDGTLTGVYPLFIRTTDSLFVFPTFYRSRMEGREKLMVFPFFSHSHDAATKERKTRVMLLYNSESRPGESSTMLFPFFHRAKEGEDRRLWLAPYYGSTTGEGDARRRYHSLVPLLFRERGKDYAFDAVAPFFFRERAGESSMMAMLPFFWREKSPESSFLLAGTFWKERSPSSRGIGLVPFYGTGSSTDHAPIVVHPGMEGPTPEGAEARPAPAPGPVVTRHWTRLLAGFYSRKAVERDGVLVSRYRRFGIFSDTLHEDGRRVFRLLGIPVRERVN